jgi:2-isopropylmalate synthase
MQNRLRPVRAFDLFDETLRDGVQSPSVHDPEIHEKLELLDLMEALNVRAADIGLPGAGKRAFDDVVAMARYARERGLKLELYTAARTVLADLEKVAEASQRSGRRIGVYAFIGSSPIRQWAEAWDLRFLMRSTAEAIRFAVKEGLEVAFVTEDTTRSSPQTLDPLFRLAVDEGVSRLVLCDTVGHASPDGTKALVDWTRGLLRGMGARVKLDWHGHNDRGLALANALAALEAGVERVHGCALGVGERVGNTALDLLLLNLQMLGWMEHPAGQLVKYVRKASEILRFPIPSNYPLSGEDAFRTATGVHAAAIIKAQGGGDTWLADRVYSSVPAGEFGQEQRIEIGPLSGMSNVRFYLQQRGIEPSEALCRAVLAAAKTRVETLREEEVLALVTAKRGRRGREVAPPSV